MNNKPILFSTPMVQAILAGRKTQTRRVINHLPHCPVHGIDPYFTSGVLLCKGCDHFPINPKYKPGDILWVRETWAEVKCDCSNPNSDPYETMCVYRADGDTVQAAYIHARRGKPDIFDFATGIKWRTSIYMPRRAARIFLRVTDVRAERLQDISHLDCIAEGIRITSSDVRASLRALDLAVRRGQVPTGVAANAGHVELLKLYRELWNIINSKRGYGWDANPWVWVYEFERVMPNEADD